MNSDGQWAGSGRRVATRTFDGAACGRLRLRKTSHLAYLRVVPILPSAFGKLEHCHWRSLLARGIEATLALLGQRWVVHKVTQYATHGDTGGVRQATSCGPRRPGVTQAARGRWPKGSPGRRSTGEAGQTSKVDGCGFPCNRPRDNCLATRMLAAASAHPARVFRTECITRALPKHRD